MKHKFWIVLLAIVATLCMAFGLAGCEEKNEQPGGNTDGIEEENVGTEGLCYTEMYGKDGKTLIGYSVGAGEAADEEEIVIPSKHNDLPVLSISRSEDDTEFWNEFYESSNRLTTAEEYDALIQKYTFCYCANLKKITIPKSIISIEKGAFSSCENLEEVHISDLAAWCNIKFGGARATPLTYARHLFIDGKEITQLEIPSSVTSIGNYVFEGCSGLTGELKIPSSVTSIGVHAFGGCSGLTSIVIPSSVTSIQGEAFVACDGLKEVHISDLAAWCRIKFSYSDATNPLDYAHHLFMDGKEITKLEIPFGVTSIESRAFEDCSGLTSAVIPDSVNTIGSLAFVGCNRLTSVNLIYGQ